MNDTQRKAFAALERSITKARAAGLYLVADAGSISLRALTAAEADGTPDLNGLGEGIALDNACGASDSVNMDTAWTGHNDHAQRPIEPAPSSSLRAVAEEVIRLSKTLAIAYPHEILAMKRLAPRLAAEVIRLEAEVERLRTVVTEDDRAMRAARKRINEIDRDRSVSRTTAQAAGDALIWLNRVLTPKQEDSPDGR